MDQVQTRTGSFLERVLEIGVDFFGDTVEAGQQHLYSKWFGNNQKPDVPTTQPVVTQTTPVQGNFLSNTDPMLVAGVAGAALLVAVVLLKG